MPQPADSKSSSKGAAWFMPGGSVLQNQGDEYDVGYHKSVYPNPDTRFMLSNVDMMSLLLVFSIPGW